MRKVLSILPIISLGFVSRPSTLILFLTKIISEPMTINIAKKEINIKFKTRLIFPKLSCFSLLTYLEKSPKLTIKIEKYANKVPVTVIKGNKFDFEIKLSKFKTIFAELITSLIFSPTTKTKNISNPK